MAKKFKRSTGPHMTKNPSPEPKQVICSLCGLRGGTLVRDNGGYKHQNPNFCRKVKAAEDRRKADEYVKKLKAEEAKEKENAGGN